MRWSEHGAVAAPSAARRRRALILALVVVTTTASLGLANVLGDIVMNERSEDNGVPAVKFPHWKHRVEFRCYACHPEPFEMRAGSNDITMDALRQGEYCGRCHDGDTAFAIGFDTCRECHSQPEP